MTHPSPQPLTPITIDDAVRLYGEYSRGNGGFDELDFKGFLEILITRERLDEQAYALHAIAHMNRKDAHEFILDRSLALNKIIEENN